MIETVDRYAPNFKASVLGRQIISRRSISSAPSAWSAATSSTARSTLDQMFSARPMLGHADYRGPMPGLYMCGSGTHPGGGVTGAPGHNAAREDAAGFQKRSVLILRCERSEPRRMVSGFQCLAAILRDARRLGLAPPG